ncbi:MAG: hypothetical protein GIKADHBN_03119 [Phycisphaerales bacterium]|nr:hypothetical protein [Phycisphaerales bacterium]
MPHFAAHAGPQRPATGAHRRVGRAMLTLALILPAGHAIAADLHVPSQHPTIQAAIDAASNGDSVVIAPGTYAEAFSLSGKAITVRSSEGPDVTIIDGASLPDQTLVLAIDRETFQTVLEGLTFMNGQGSLRPNCTAAKPVGGAVYIGQGGALTIRGCRFVHNGFDRDLVWGGAVYSHRGSLRIFDCEFTDNGGYTSVRGLGVVNGGAVGQCGDGSLEISRCIFTENFAGYGGAVRTHHSPQVLISDCIFAGNSADVAGGVHSEPCGQYQMTGCDFIGNSSSHGGGAFITTTCGFSEVRACTFTDNQAAFGGGLRIDLFNDGTPGPVSTLVQGCRFSGNAAGFGGGLYVDGRYIPGPAGDHPSCTVADSIFTANTASACCGVGNFQNPCWKDGVNYGQTFYGGGADVRVLDGATADVFNCVFADNTGVRGGGLSVAACGEPEFNLFGGTVRVANCTVHENDGTGLELRIGRTGTISVANSIIRDNTAAQEIATTFKNPVSGQATINVNYSNVQGGYAGTSNTDQDPLFADPSTLDYRLRSGSPAIDAGDSGALPATFATDLAGNPRRVDDPAMPDTGAGSPPIDLGAYEFQGSCPADFDGSGFVDTDDFTAFVLAFEAGTDDADFDGSGFVDTDDFTAFVLAFEAGC